MRANGVRYPLVGGTRQRHLDGIHSKPHKVPENAQTPTSRVHAVLGGINDRFQQRYWGELYMPIVYGVDLLLSTP